MYRSEFTEFMNAFLEKNPEVDYQRRELRLTLWEPSFSRDDQARWQASEVPQKPYVYQPD